MNSSEIWGSVVSRCKTRKRRYRDEIAAKLALATIQREDKAHRPDQEVRAYYCRECHGWHLTHREEWKKE